MVVVGVWGQGRMGSCCLTGTEFQFYNEKNNKDGGW